MKKTTLCYIEQDGKYLMLYRNKKENDLNEGKWVGVGGKFEEDETPDECLLREVFEETGFTLTDYSFRGIIKFVSDKWGTEFMCLYSAKGFEGELRSCNEGEFSWIDKGAVRDLPIWEGDKAIFDALESHTDFFTMEVIYNGDTLVNCPVPVPSPIGRLYEMQDKKYRTFQAKLTPNVSIDAMIGVRIPLLRKFAKEYIKTADVEGFLSALPHYFYDENLLHGIIISEEKDYEKSIQRLEEFLPFVDNWAVCDTISPKCFKKNRKSLIEKIVAWSASDRDYTCRFGLEMLMSHFLDEDFKPEYLEIPASVTLKDYYVKMMVAWFFATALAKQWEATIPYIEKRRLDEWTHNKTIQKANESYRVSDDKKEYLKSLRVK